MHKTIRNIIASILTLSLATYASNPIDVEASSVTWLGKKVTGQHSGSLQLKEGSVELKNQTLTGGRFVFDMTSIRVLDIKDEKWSTKLENHLKSEDFFTTAKYPQATFEITSSQALKNSPPGAFNYDIKGELTIKGITHVVSFPARVDIQQDHASARGEIIVDRTRYGIQYKSGKFFESLGDKTIYDDFYITFHVLTELLKP